MTADDRLLSERFARSSRYHPEWVTASASGGANSLWMTEWLAEALDLKPGMRVLDLGCGRAASSIFLCREFGVQVWATDLWFSASENLRRIRDAGVAGLAAGDLSGQCYGARGGGGRPRSLPRLRSRSGSPAGRCEARGTRRVDLHAVREGALAPRRVELVLAVGTPGVADS